MTDHKCGPSPIIKVTCFDVAFWYFVTSTSDTGSFSLVPVIASEMHGIAANNASTFHIAITGNQTIMNHESFHKLMESPVHHFTQRVFWVSFIFPQGTRQQNCVGSRNELISIEYSYA